MPNMLSIGRIPNYIGAPARYMSAQKLRGYAHTHHPVGALMASQVARSVGQPQHGDNKGAVRRSLQYISPRATQHSPRLDAVNRSLYLHAGIDISIYR